MPQRQRHRGRHPEDGKLFAPGQIAVLRRAVSDLSFLLTRDYAERAALKLVGDHYQLDVRQRRAVLGASCSSEAMESREQRFVAPSLLCGQVLAIDGYNLLITTESLLAGGVLLRGRDGCIRDLASVHRSYHKVEETMDALRLIGQVTSDLGIAQLRWIFDAPVSNSGRLRQTMQEESARHGWPWEVSLAAKVDKLLASSGDLVVTSDGWILDRAPRWTHLTDTLLNRSGLDRTVIDLGG